jgi:acetolactate synthase-1/2/3 large subunit
MIAEAYGIKAECVHKQEDLDKALKRMISHKGAYLLEVKTRKEENVFPMVPAGASLDDIIF